LELGSNKLTALPGIMGQIVKLKKLWVENNNLSSLPEEFASLVNLEEVFFDDNCFREIPMVLCTFSKLQKLYFKNNKIASLSPAISNLRALKSVGFSGNKGLPKGHQIDLIDQKPAVQRFLKTLLNETEKKSKPNGNGGCCSYCHGDTLHLLQCSGCRMMLYCSSTCQNADWGFKHKLECCGIRECKSYLQTLAHAPGVKSLGGDPNAWNPKHKGYVKDGHWKCFDEGEADQLFTFGAATCVVLIIFGRNKVSGKERTMLQHLSGFNNTGQPLANIPRDLEKILGAEFVFESGCIIPGEFLTNELLAPSLAPRDPTMQLLLWEELKPFPWKAKLQVWTGVKATDLIEVRPNFEVTIFHRSP
jgi:hypothetical protein